MKKRTGIKGQNVLTAYQEVMWCMGKYCIAVLLLVLTACASDTIDIPDAAFKNALLNTKCIDTDGDGKADSDADTNDDNQIQISEVANLTFLDVSAQNIQSLEGIEHFVSLKGLDCYKNALTSLDVTKNTKLEILFCFDNEIVELDMSQNVNLVELGCRGNKLESLDLRNNKMLKIVYCYKNNLRSLNLQNGNNANISSVWTFENPALMHIKVDDADREIPSCNRKDYGGWCKDEHTVYTI